MCCRVQLQRTLHRHSTARGLNRCGSSRRSSGKSERAPTSVTSAASRRSAATACRPAFVAGPGGKPVCRPARSAARSSPATSASRRPATAARSALNNKTPV